MWLFVKFSNCFVLILFPSLSFNKCSDLQKRLKTNLTSDPLKIQLYVHTISALKENEKDLINSYHSFFTEESCQIEANPILSLSSHDFLPSIVPALL